MSIRPPDVLCAVASRPALILARRVAPARIAPRVGDDRAAGRRHHDAGRIARTESHVRQSRHIRHLEIEERT